MQGEAVHGDEKAAEAREDRERDHDLQRRVFDGQLGLFFFGVLLACLILTVPLLVAVLASGPVLHRVLDASAAPVKMTFEHEEDDNIPAVGGLAQVRRGQVSALGLERRPGTMVARLSQRVTVCAVGACGQRIWTAGPCSSGRTVVRALELVRNSLRVACEKQVALPAWELLGLAVSQHGVAVIFRSAVVFLKGKALAFCRSLEQPASSCAISDGAVWLHHGLRLTRVRWDLAFDDPSFMVAHWTVPRWHKITFAGRNVVVAELVVAELVVAEGPERSVVWNVDSQQVVGGALGPACACDCSALGEVLAVGSAGLRLVRPDGSSRVVSEAAVWGRFVDLGYLVRTAEAYLLVVDGKDKETAAFPSPAACALDSPLAVGSLGSRIAIAFSDRVELLGNVEAFYLEAGARFLGLADAAIRKSKTKKSAGQAVRVQVAGAFDRTGLVFEPGEKLVQTQQQLQFSFAPQDCTAGVSYTPRTLVLR
jgi:hypothetical protein